MSLRKRTKDHRVWRAKVIRRDKVCKVCGSKKNREAHHINSYSYYPEERYKLENGVCLCRDCHTAFHTMYKKSFRQKCNRDDWNNFLDLVSYIRRL